MSESLGHLEWIADIVQRSSLDSPSSELLAIYVSEFANFNGGEKRDIFLYLLGRVVSLTNNDKESNDG